MSVGFREGGRRRGEEEESCCFISSVNRPSVRWRWRARERGRRGRKGNQRRGSEWSSLKERRRKTDKRTKQLLLIPSDVINVTKRDKVHHPPRTEPPPSLQTFIV